MPLIVIVFDAHVADTPAGKPFAPDTPLFDIPVAPVVAIVILGDNTVLIHCVGVEDGLPAVLLAVTITVILALAVNPLPSVTVTEYGVVEIGETIIEGVLAPVLHK